VPLQKLQFRPGVNREGTTLANEGGWFESDNVRFRSGYPEKIGGWTVIDGSYNTFVGVCRSLWNWATLNNFVLLGVGTNLKFYIAWGGQYFDITPVRSTTAAGDVTFAATTGSSTITVTDNGWSGQSGDFVTFSGAVALSTQVYTAAVTDVLTLTTALPNGTAVQVFTTNATPGGLSTGLTYYVINASGATCKLASSYPSSSAINITSTGTGTQTLALATGITAGVLNQQYQVTYAGANSYTFQARTAGTTVEAPGPIVVANSSDSGDGGAAVVGEYQISTGSDIYTVASGWGAGPWNGAAIGVSTDPWAHGWGTAYTSGLDVQLRLWDQSNFGEILLFSPRGGALYEWDPGSGTTPAFTTPGQLVSGTDVPAFTNQIMVADASRIVIALGCSDYGSYPQPQDPMLIRWTAQESYTNWTPSISNQAGSYRLSHGSYIVAGVQTRQEILVWTDAALYSMQYLGSPFIWGFNILADNISIISPNAMASASGVTYWMGTDKFYVYSGRVETLPCALRTYVFGDINRDQAFQIVSGTNEGFSEVWWFYCSANSTVVDRYVIFNYLDRVWYYGSMSRTAWLDSPLREYPQAASSIQASSLSAAIDATQTTISLVNPSGYPASGAITLDSEIITYAAIQGNLLQGCVRGANSTVAASHVVYTYAPLYASNLIVFHESGVDDGLYNPPRAISSYVQSSDFNIGDGHNYGFVWQIIPDITFDGSIAPASSDPDNPTNFPQVTFTLRPRQNPGSNYGVADTPTVKSTKSYAPANTYNVQEFTEIVYARARGRQMAFKVSSDTIGTQWQLGTPSINVRPDGRR